MLGRLRRAVLASWLALGPGLCAISARARGTEGATEDELAAARALFAEALKDEEAKRFVDALDKFQRVRAVRDTAQIEYRIGSCYEGLGQPAPAYAAYRQATVLGQDELKSADVVAAAVERVHALAKHLGWLSLTLPARASSDMQVRVDDAVMPLAALGDPIVLEPGPHVVTATAHDAAPYRSSIVLPEGAHVALTVALEPVPAPGSAGPLSAASGTQEVNTRRAEMPSSREETQDAGRRTVGWITVGGGGALLLGAGAVALAGASDISTLNNNCPRGGQCAVPNGSNEMKDLESIRSRAVPETTVAIALGAAGLVTAGLGAYLVLSSKDALPTAGGPRLRIGPLVGMAAQGITLCGQFR
jgi:hypothetical protein